MNARNAPGAPGAPDALAALDDLRTGEGWLTASSRAGRFASLFGRDSLIAALQYLPYDASIADATLERLARDLGTRVDPETEEEPGRVPHEVRDADLDLYVQHGWPVRDGRLRYYGTIDANAWWLIVLGALARHGGDVRRHRVAGGRVAAWLAGRPQPLAYERRATSGGLAHQWWRDAAADRAGATTHGMFTDEGTWMRPPVAAAAVQALTWRALAEAAAFVDASFGAAADAARHAFVDAFLLTDDAVPPLARHGDGVATSASSDLGIVVWSGVLDGFPAEWQTVRRLLDADLRTPYGLRTLPVGHPAFRPDGYHTGGVWPWDSWIGAGGVAAVAPDEGRALWDGVRAAAASIGGFPELYGVAVDGALLPSAEACTLQAWTAGAVAAIEAGWDGRAWAHE